MLINRVWDFFFTTEGRTDYDNHKAMEESFNSIVSIPLIIFVVLKLTGQITWNWLWVLSPLWIAYSLLGVFAVFLIALDWCLKRRTDKDIEAIRKMWDNMQKTKDTQ